MEKGCRVGAVMGGGNGIVMVFGFGEYVGDEIPTENAKGYAKFLRSGGLRNPKIVLDDGKIVWGSECWWGEEEEMKKLLKKYETVEYVDIDMMRNKC